MWRGSATLYVPFVRNVQQCVEKLWKRNTQEKSQRCRAVHKTVNCFTRTSQKRIPYRSVVCVTTGTSVFPKSSMQCRPERRRSRASLSLPVLLASLPHNHRSPPPSTLPPVPYRGHTAPNFHRRAQSQDSRDDSCSTEYDSGPRERHSVIGDHQLSRSEIPVHRSRPIEFNRMERNTTFSLSSSDSSKKAVPGGNILVQVRRWVLEGNGTALRKGGRLSEIRKKGIGYKTVTVEGNIEGLAHTCLYASDQMIRSPLVEPYKPTEPLASRNEYVNKESVVFRDRPFEIRVVGMCVSSDAFSDDSGDILMYSIQRDVSDSTGDSDALPFIHYHPSRDGLAVRRDQFIPISASRSLFLFADGKEPEPEQRKSVNFRFNILGLDKADEAVQVCLARIEKLGTHLAQYARVTSMLGLFGPALSIANTVSQRALESLSKQDRVVKIDMNFLLADQRAGQQNRPGTFHFEHCSGEYLRYGYYFFLDTRVDAKLYASFRTFPNVQLMMKRTDADRIGPNECTYFPLTGVSYVVVRVTPRLMGTMDSKKPNRLSHIQRLEELMKAALDDDGRSGGRIVQSLAELAQELGISSTKNERDRHKIGQVNGTS